MDLYYYYYRSMFIRKNSGLKPLHAVSPTCYCDWIDDDAHTYSFVTLTDSSKTLTLKMQREKRKGSAEKHVLETGSYYESTSNFVNSYCNKLTGN